MLVKGATGACGWIYDIRQIQMVYWLLIVQYMKHVSQGEI